MPLAYFETHVRIACEVCKQAAELRTTGEQLPAATRAAIRLRRSPGLTRGLLT
jgi:hypothetical protein